MSRTIPFAVLLTTLAVPAAQAADPAAAPSSSGGASTWTLGGSAELEKGGGSSLGASLGYGSGGGTGVELSVGRSSLESDTLQTLTTSRVDATVRHRFGEDGGPTVHAGAGAWRDPDTVTARHVGAGVEFGGAALRVGLNGGWRRAEFEPFPLAGSVTLPGGRTLALTGTASCTLKNLDYGVSLTHETDAVTLYVQGTKYDYDDTSCRFSSRGLDALANARRALFRQFAANVTLRLSRGAASASDRQTTFLDFGVAAGAAWRRGPDEFGLDLDHVREEFEQSDANTLTLHWARAFASGVDLTVYAGASDSSTFGTLPFAGVSVSRTF